MLDQYYPELLEKLNGSAQNAEYSQILRDGRELFVKFLVGKDEASTFACYVKELVAILEMQEYQSHYRVLHAFPFGQGIVIAYIRS
jgi:hypothetical protein